MQTLEQLSKENQKEQLINEGRKLIGLPSGYEELDKLTNGFQAGQLTILAARPAMGITTFALNIARNIAAQSDKSIAIFTLGQTAKQLTKNFLKASDNKVNEAAIYIDDNQCASVFDIMERSAVLKHNQNIGFLIIDYLQLITGFESPDIKNEEINFEKITHLIKILAKTLNMPILLLSRLTKRVEERAGNKMPQLKDLKDYGDITKYADTVMFLYRWDYYGLTNKGDELRDRTLVLIAKNRNGQPGDFEFTY